MKPCDLMILACSVCLTGCLLHFHVDDDPPGSSAGLLPTHILHIPHKSDSTDAASHPRYSEAPVATNPSRDHWPLLIGRKIAVRGHATEEHNGRRILSMYFDGKRLPIILPHETEDPRSLSLEPDDMSNKQSDHGPVYVEGILQNVHSPMSLGQQGGRSVPKPLDHYHLVATRVIPLSKYATESEDD